jgi:copper chaperone
MRDAPVGSCGKDRPSHHGKVKRGGLDLASVASRILHALPANRAPTMLSYTIDAMTCGNCVRHITRAVQALAPTARIEADLPSHQVRIETDADAGAVRQALVDAGYPPRPA